MKTNLFKSAIAILIALTLIIPVFALSSSAEDSGALTLDEANKLLADAYYLASYATHLNRSRPFVIENGDFVKMPGSNFFYLVDEAQLPGGSFNGMVEFAKSIYTEDLYLELSSNSRAFFGGDFSSDPTSFNFKKGDDGKLYRESECISWFGMAIDITTYKPETVVSRIESSSDTEAVVSVACSMGDTGKIYWIECKFVNTADGWRIARSAFTDKMANGGSLSMDGIKLRDDMEPGSGVDSPSTADASFGDIVFFTALGVLSLTAAAVVCRRRRAV